MRSTRAAAAVARLNQRSEGHQYLMVVTGNGQFLLRERVEGVDKALSETLSLDDFVRFRQCNGAATSPSHYQK
jgi:hypothetical protein